MVCVRIHRHGPPVPTRGAAEAIYEALEADSPLSTKELKKITGLQGKAYSGEYQRAMSSLFKNLLIVGYGEVEDGAFPSLAVGATRLIHEDLWTSGLQQDLAEAEDIIEQHLLKGSPLRKFFDRS